MNTITINLPDERFVQLKEAAGRLGVAPEELARASIEDMLMLPDEIFSRTLDNLLKKNAELYQRLAAL
ncbi:MAG: DNA-binding protein [Candidatus Latescibacter sp.]|nr:DNA-binding protein [Candidatus Latescibacter sp.]